MSLSFHDVIGLRRFCDSLQYLKIAVIVLVGLTGPSGEIAAQTWEIVPRIATGAQYESNPRHLSDDSRVESATGLIVDLRLPMVLETERTTATLTPRLINWFYRKEVNQDLEAQNKYVNAAVSHATLRSSTGLAAGWSDVELRNSESEFDDGTGLPVLIDSTVRRWNVNPYWSYQLTEVNSVSLNGGYSEYRNHPTSLNRFRFDYDSSFLSAGYNHRLTLKNSIGFRANLSKFDSFQPTTETTNDSTSNGLSLVFSRAISDTVSTSVNLGWARTKSEGVVTVVPINIPGFGPACLLDDGSIVPPSGNPAQCAPRTFKSDSTNFVGNISIGKRSESAQYDLSIGQSITPNSNGAEVIRRTLSANANREFTDHLSGMLGLYAYEQKDVGDLRPFTRHFVGVNLSGTWRFNPRWSATLRYRFLYNEYSEDLFFNEFDNTNNTLFLGIVYNGEGWRSN